MKNNSRGFIVPLVLIVVLLVGGGAYIYKTTRVETQSSIAGGTPEVPANTQSGKRPDVTLNPVSTKPSTATTQNPKAFEQPVSFKAFFGDAGYKGPLAIAKNAANNAHFLAGGDWCGDWNAAEKATCPYPLIYVASSDKTKLIVRIDEGGNLGFGRYALDLANGIMVRIDGRGFIASPDNKAVAIVNFKGDSILIYQIETGTWKLVAALSTTNTSVFSKSSFGGDTADVRWLDSSTIEYGIHNTTANASSDEETSFYDLLKKERVTI